MTPTQTEQTTNIVQQFLQALVSRDLDAIVMLFSETTDWYIPGDEKLVPWLGRRESRKDIATFYEMLWAATEPLSAQVDHIVAQEDFAVITGEFSTKMLATEKIVDSIFSIHITVKDNLIVKYILQEDSYAVAQALTT